MPCAENRHLYTNIWCSVFSGESNMLIANKQFFYLVFCVQQDFVGASELR